MKKRVFRKRQDAKVEKAEKVDATTPEETSEKKVVSRRRRVKKDE